MTPVGTISTIVDDTFAFSESLALNLYRGVLQTMALAEDSSLPGTGFEAAGVAFDLESLGDAMGQDYDRALRRIFTRSLR